MLKNNVLHAIVKTNHSTHRFIYIVLILQLFSDMMESNQIIYLFLLILFLIFF